MEGAGGDEVVLGGEGAAAAVEGPCKVAGTGPDGVGGGDVVHEGKGGFEFGVLVGVAHAAEDF